jgi:hypothetical protein
MATLLERVNGTGGLQDAPLDLNLPRALVDPLTVPLITCTPIVGTATVAAGMAANVAATVENGPGGTDDLPADDPVNNEVTY